MAVGSNSIWRRRKHCETERQAIEGALRSKSNVQCSRSPLPTLNFEPGTLNKKTGGKMKIVLFGPERRVGAWQNDKIIDLNHALTNYLRDQRRETNAQARADEKIPPQLERFIALGKAAIEDAERAI